jgi:hypothetical protein
MQEKKVVTKDAIAYELEHWGDRKKHYSPILILFK